MAETCPTDFRYWEAVRRPGVRLARRLSRALLRHDPLPPDDVARAICEDMYAGDPVAEAFVDEVFFADGDPAAARKGRALLDRALDHGIEAVPEAPESMRRLFAEFEDVPDWVDTALVEEGARIWRRWGTTLFFVGGASTLEMYTESAVALPLSLTGGYAGDNALRRFLETARFWIDVSEPGALHRIGSAGRATALRVRVMHVSVRRRVAGHEEWDSSRWGLPISQTWMMMTLMGGSTAPALAMWPLGFQTSPREIRALLHYQRYLGHLLGVRPRHYPETVRESLQLLAAVVLARSYTAGHHGAELIESFPEAFAPRGDPRGLARLRAIYEYRMVCAFCAYLVAPATRRRVRMPPAFPWLGLLALRTPVIAAGEVGRRLHPALADRQERRSCERRERWLERQMEGRTAAFEAASGLRR